MVSYTVLMRLFLFFPDVPLLVCRNATNFCRLILSPVTLLNLLVLTVVFIGILLEFSIYNIMPSANGEKFLFLFG